MKPSVIRFLSLPIMLMLCFGFALIWICFYAVMAIIAVWQSVRGMHE
jgi:hypothetical protein